MAQNMSELVELPPYSVQKGQFVQE
jgi:hypothetical protein